MKGGWRKETVAAGRRETRMEGGQGGEVGEKARWKVGWRKMAEDKDDR